MRLLAFDTTGDRLSLALSEDGRLRRRLGRVGVDQDELLPREVERLLRAAHRRLSDIDVFVAAVGPGRFTGIRVGLTFAGMLSKALGKKAVGVSWLEACAWRAEPEAASMVAVVRGWKGELFAQAFRRGTEGPQAIHPPRWVSAAGSADLEGALKDDLKGARWLWVGPGAPGAPEAPLHAADLIAPARARLLRGDTSELAPLYIKPAHYERP